MTPLEKIIEQLQPDEKKEVVEYIESLKAKRTATGSVDQGAFSFKWIGALASLKGRYSSVSLQHDAQKWR
ncbi:MAG TPA: DUF2281 domain-containing protein [Spirochaetota bacterium]|nr:DUF2281 domain-containing protein [Spirochaetota bacterium]